MRDLITKTSEEIMTTLYKPTVFAVAGLLAQGLFILAGSPKVGKSWLALELCLAVAKGEKLFERETSQGSVLYFCLEDSYTRIQSRLYELTYDTSGDNSAGRKLYPETCCPAGTQDVESSLDTFSAQGDGTTQGDGRSCSGDSTDPEYLLIDGKQVPVVRSSVGDVINRSAAKIRAQDISGARYSYAEIQKRNVSRFVPSLHRGRVV